jgi:acetoin utilization deacetylase AcuC-like enzyme
VRKTAIFRDDLFLEHISDFNHVESPERLQVIYKELDRPEIAEKFVFPAWGPASQEVLKRIHTKALVKQVAATSGKTFASLDPDTQTSPQSYAAACQAAGAVIKGAAMVAAGEVDNCFALVRPPGHHAEADRAMGFCLFNNIAVGARYALDELKMNRVFIIDWDLHHGNGTQHSFYDTDQVLYMSTHQYPYYPGSGGLTEVGSGRGEGFTVNVPLAGGQDDSAYGRIFREVLVPVVKQYKPDIIMVSAGFDTYIADPLGTMAVTARGFAYMTRILVELAAEVCDNRLLVALEGGYNLEGLRDGVLAVLGELTGLEDCSDQRFNRLGRATIDQLEQKIVHLPVLDQVRDIAKKYWEM